MGMASFDFVTVLRPIRDLRTIVCFFIRSL